MSESTYYRCSGRGYEFLSKAHDPTCPHCKSGKLESKDIKILAGMDE